MSCNCKNNEGFIVKGQDFVLNLSINPKCNNNDLHINTFDWEVIIWSGYDESNFVKLKSTNGNITSTGTVPATASGDGENIKVCVKASKHPLNEGTISTQLSIMLPDEDFIDNVKVIKSRKIASNVMIVS